MHWVSLPGLVQSVGIKIENSPTMHELRETREHVSVILCGPSATDSSQVRALLLLTGESMADTKPNSDRRVEGEEGGGARQEGPNSVRAGALRRLLSLSVRPGLERHATHTDVTSVSLNGGFSDDTDADGSSGDGSGDYLVGGASVWRSNRAALTFSVIRRGLTRCPQLRSARFPQSACGGTGKSRPQQNHRRGLWDHRIRRDLFDAADGHVIEREKIFEARIVERNAGIRFCRVVKPEIQY